MEMEKEKSIASQGGNCFDQSPKTQQIAVPTTFVQADTSSFRELVQKLTGISDESQEKLPITMPARYYNRSGVGAKQVQAEAVSPLSSASSCSKIEVGPRKSAFKLQERRQSMRKLEIQLGLTSLRLNPLSPRSGEIRSPNVTDLQALHAPSPVTPLASDPFHNVNGYSPSSTPNAATPTSDSSEEERAIAEKGFYLHPSPRQTPRGSDPELLPLFPLHSPREPNS
ncbi:hypothetical protein SUGI_0259260 [Cryptomeria japonica]|uniref:VQ motif-containing protein 4 n=1 Tax=Cryptomeria japonica TaxID=3369 RepID=UPI002408AF28|nr:VQ motif-containing protein 4 [Cryptomeria japonica]GLJ15754.1 hypothetical protein SUGI_0259260 [Cryptomeria japonica]